MGQDPTSGVPEGTLLHAGLHRFYRQRDLVLLIVRYEDMSLNEQMQHRIGNLPAFRIFSQASLLLMQPPRIKIVQMP